MIALRGRGEASRVGFVTGLDQPSSAGTSAALHRLGRDLNVLDLVRCDSARLIEGRVFDAAPSAHLGAQWLRTQ